MYGFSCYHTTACLTLQKTCFLCQLHSLSANTHYISLHNCRFVFFSKKKYSFGAIKISRDVRPLNVKEIQSDCRKFKIVNWSNSAGNTMYPYKKAISTQEAVLGKLLLKSNQLQLLVTTVKK